MNIAYLCVSGPTMGFANSCTNALEANMMPTATVSPTKSLCRCRLIISSGDSVAFSEIHVLYFKKSIASIKKVFGCCSFQILNFKTINNLRL